MSDFISMGGYGAFVWSAFGLTILVLVWNWIDARRQFAHAVKVARFRQTASSGESQ